METNQLCHHRILYPFYLEKMLQDKKDEWEKVQIISQGLIQNPILLWKDTKTFPNHHGEAAAAKKVWLLPESRVEFKITDTGYWSLLSQVTIATKPFVESFASKVGNTLTKTCWKRERESRFQYCQQCTVECFSRLCFVVKTSADKMILHIFDIFSHDFSHFSTQLTLFRPKNSIGLKKDWNHVRNCQKFAKSSCRPMFSQRNKTLQNLPLCPGGKFFFSKYKGENIRRQM